MIPPPCIRCGTPVKRAKGSWLPVRGHRIVDGVRWCWYCSRQCNGSNKDRLTPDIRARIGRAHREMAERRTLKRIIEACKGAMDARGMVKAQTIARVWMEENRKAYSRGFTVAWHQGKRDRKKAEAA